MTKILKSLCLTVMLMLACCSVSFAASQAIIPEGEMLLGGLYVGMASEEVQDYYGVPDDIATVDGKTYYRYGDSVYILFWPASYQKGMQIQAIEVTANNGFKTPAGLHVGMTYNEMVSLYGKHPVANVSDDSRKTYNYYAYNGATLKITTMDGKITKLQISKQKKMD